MNPHVSVITLGVHDLDRAKRFYSEGVGWPIQQQDFNWVCFSLGDGSSALALYPWAALADDAGVSADGSGLSRHHPGVQRPERGSRRCGAGGIGTRRWQDRQASASRLMGRLQRLLLRPRGLPLGGGDRRDEVALLRVVRLGPRGRGRRRPAHQRPPVQTSVQPRVQPPDRNEPG